MAASSIVYRGDTVEEGMGPVRCSRTVDGRLCLGVIGFPRVGSTLVERFDREKGEHIGPCHRVAAGFMCQDCGAVAVFR